MIKNTNYLLLGLLLCLLHATAYSDNHQKLDGPNSGTSRIYADHSVLSSGDWYKIAVSGSGICRISFSYLQSIGVNMATLNPRDVRIYGNGGGMLPEGNSAFRFDDLQENAIEVIGEEDGIFDVTDYILFYAQGPVVWNYNVTQGAWEHRQNVYTDSSYYFISTNLGKGKRIPVLKSESVSPTNEVSTYDYRSFHEKDAVNLIKSGRLWFGEIFDITSEYVFNFDVPNLVSGSELVFKISAAARATSSSSFTCNYGSANWQISLSPISTYYNSPHASGATSFKRLEATAGPVSLQMRYNKSTSTALGWLDFIDLSTRAQLQFNGGQFDFRDLASVGAGNIAEFKVAAAAGRAVVWDVTQVLSPRKVEVSAVGNDLTFVLSTDTLREFVAFDNSSLIVPRFVGKVLHQDLHATRNMDMVIVAPPLFYQQALRLANYHASVDDLSTIVLTPELIYNEFSSGAPDVIGIRDFMKMLYDRGTTSGMPKYLLLFGDGSYDNKDRLAVNTNFIPTWQTTESFDPVRSGVSDDYYGLLDNTEGLTFTDKIDLGIGRLPVKTVEEAEAMVDKIIHYLESNSEIMGDWRNIIAFIADDEDGNEHIYQADNMASVIEENYPDFNVDKIYMDAYFQQSTTAGARYPEVNKAITQRVEKGCLMLNYTGHGGETGWAHEQVLEVQEINSWTNYANLPVFVTATCEFSRFDDPNRTSAGELVFLNERGGGIALFTTTRPTYGSPNFELNKSLYKYALSPTLVAKPRLGDVMKEAKRESGSDENGRKFILLGDPAQSFAFPELKVVTTTINGINVGPSPDTLKAYTQVTVAGIITDRSGNLVPDFNGLVIPTVYDKALEQQTLGNDGGSPFSFSLQKSILYRGKVLAENGTFTFTFMVPRDIAYQYGYGKLSYYATDEDRDGSGSYNNFVIGGSAGNSSLDAVGPEITLFMNDEKFIEGGITNENPWLVAIVSDENGINTIGSGIGHDITAVLDGVNDEPYILNDFYESDVNTFRSGKIRFPLSQLEPGDHEITVKVWDIFNNSTESSIRFRVHGSKEFLMQNPVNYPNPFNSSTELVFEHNKQGLELVIKADIYTITGQLVCSIEQTSAGDGALSVPIKWDGRSTYGAIMDPGIYLYTLMATSSDGLQATTNGKMILAK